MFGVGEVSLRDRLSHGDTLIGAFVQAPSTVVCEFLGSLGFDFLCLEAEHSAMNPETIQNLIVAAERGGTAAMVRIADNGWTLVANALDAGAAGVVCPRVNSAEEAVKFAQSGLYPPVGQRGIGPGRITGYGPNSGASYRDWANDHILRGVQIETREAVEQLKGIVETPGIDLVFVGPADLSVSLGLMPGSVELQSVIEDILLSVQAAGKVSGIWAPNVEMAKHWVDRGAKFILVASDLMFLAKGAEEFLKLVMKGA